MFQGWNTTSYTNTISLICGFLIIFSGVYLLDMVAPISNLKSCSLLELPFNSSSCRVTASSVNNEKGTSSRHYNGSGNDVEYYTDMEGEEKEEEENDHQQPNRMRRKKRPRALSV